MDRPAQIHVLIPSVFTKFTEGRQSLVLRAETVQQAIECLVKEFPALQAQLLDDRGQWLSYVQLFVNDDHIRDLAEFETTLEDNDELVLVPALAGG